LYDEVSQEKKQLEEKLRQAELEKERLDSDLKQAQDSLQEYEESEEQH